MKKEISGIFLMFILTFSMILPFTISFNCPFNSKKLLPAINGFVDTNFTQLSSFPLIVEDNNKILNLTLYFANNETHFYVGVKLFNGSALNEGFDFDVILYDGTTIDRKYVSYDSSDGPFGTDKLVDLYYNGTFYDYDPDFHFDGLGAINLSYKFSAHQYFYQGEILFPLKSGHLGDIQVDSNREVSIAFMFYFKSALYFYPSNSHNWTAGIHPILSSFSRINLTISVDFSNRTPPENNIWIFLLILMIIIGSGVILAVYLKKRKNKMKRKKNGKSIR